MERDTGNAVRPTSSTMKNKQPIILTQSRYGKRKNQPAISCRAKNWNFKVRLPRSEQHSKSNGANTYYAKKNGLIAGFREKQSLAQAN